ncbi:hypothetical protein [Bordetella petrii]|uniref:hypothetical protein n=1 Tax=Bordetella petrii TaxID=94624 RepID=UPI00373268D3
MDDLKRTHAIVALLRQTTNKDVVADFLKAKDLASSGTWDDLLTKRIVPAVADNKVSNDELIALLRSAEEHGKQHVFLYQTPKATAQDRMARARITAELKRRKIEAILVQPMVLDQPDTPTIVDVRWESAHIDLSVTVKEVERRESQRFARQEHSADGKRLIKTYDVVRERAVNVVRLHHDGLLEMRISARSTGSTKYDQDVKMFWNRLRGIVDLGDYKPLPLAKFKAKLLDPAALAGVIRSSGSTLRNADGTVMNMSSRGADADLYGDGGAADGISAFAARGGFCDGSNFFFTKNAHLSKDVHILVSGAVNEFAVTADCSEEDYRYVLSQVRRLNT